jgi:hypothetical protein
LVAFILVVTLRQDVIRVGSNDVPDPGEQLVDFLLFVITQDLAFGNILVLPNRGNGQHDWHGIELVLNEQNINLYVLVEQLVPNDLLVFFDDSLINQIIELETALVDIFQKHQLMVVFEFRVIGLPVTHDHLLLLCAELWEFNVHFAEAVVRDLLLNYFILLVDLLLEGFLLRRDLEAIVLGPRGRKQGF